MRISGALRGDDWIAIEHGAILWRAIGHATNSKFFGDSGSDPGQFTLPHGMAFDSHGHLYIADAGNQRIQRFEIHQP